MGKRAAACGTGVRQSGRTSERQHTHLVQETSSEVLVYRELACLLLRCALQSHLQTGIHKRPWACLAATPGPGVAIVTPTRAAALALGRMRNACLDSMMYALELLVYEKVTGSE